MEQVKSRTTGYSLGCSHIHNDQLMCKSALAPSLSMTTVHSPVCLRMIHPTRGYFSPRGRPPSHALTELVWRSSGACLVCWNYNMFLIRNDFKDDGNGVRFVGMRKFVSVSLDSKYVVPSASLPSKLIVKKSHQIACLNCSKVGQTFNPEAAVAGTAPLPLDTSLTFWLKAPSYVLPSIPSLLSTGIHWFAVNLS